MRTERLPERAHPGSLAIVGGRIRADSADVEGISSLAAPTECRLVIRDTSVPVAKVEDRHERERRCLLRQVLSENLDDTIAQLVQVQRLFVRQDPPRVRLVEHLLERHVRHRRDQLKEGRHRVPDRLDKLGVLLRRPIANDDQGEARSEVVLLWNKRRRWGAESAKKAACRMRQRLQVIAAEAKGRGPFVDAPKEQAQVNQRADRAKSILERRHDTKIAAAAAVAQKRSGFSFAAAVRILPSAVTTCAETRLSQLSPACAVKCPIPPPSVSPPMPVRLMNPPVTASPCAWVAASRSCHVAPPPATARRAAGSTVTCRSSLRSSIKPPSQTANPAKLWPPPRTEISRDWSVPNLIAAATSCGVVHRAITAGRRLMAPLKTERALLYSGSSGVITFPVNSARNAPTDVPSAWAINLPSAGVG